MYTVLGSILMTIFIFLVTIIQKTGPTPPLSYFTAQHLPPPAELKQASKMLGWEIPSPLEENPTHTYAGRSLVYNNAVRFGKLHVTEQMTTNLYCEDAKPHLVSLIKRGARPPLAKFAVDARLVLYGRKGYV